MMNQSIHYGDTLAPIGSLALVKMTSSNSFDINLPAGLTWRRHIALRVPASRRNFLRFTITEILFSMLRTNHWAGSARWQMT